jgi:phenylalanyl-tRNA synthetase beta chain
MRLPLEWLHEFCAPALDAGPLAERLSMTGTNVERLLRHEGADVIELEITPNRPDCLGVYGVAREVHAATGAELAEPPWTADPGSLEPEVPDVQIIVEAPDLCPRFTARVYEDVRSGPSPPWLRARLTAAGQRPISNVVDVTNYVMLLTGQPLHAFDLDLVAGGRLVVRRAGEGERLRTLDGVERELDSDAVVICDDQGPSSLAGIMGGERSEVGDGTTRVLMESATWAGDNIQRSSVRLGLRSEASSRFEKWLSPESAMEAQAMAARLLTEVVGARLAPGTIDVGGPGPEPGRVRLRTERVASLLGAEVSAERCAEILEALGFGVAAAEGGLEATVPHWRRRDVGREVDLIEEVARIDGVDRLPATLPPRRGAAGRLTHAQRLRRRAEDVLVGRGLYESVGWSFAPADLADRLRLGPADPRRAMVALENPLSAEQSLMRSTLLGSLLDVVARNAAHGTADLALFEAGVVHRAVDGAAGGGDTGAVEHHALGALCTGTLAPASWREGAGAEWDFFAVKALVEALLDALGVSFETVPAQEPFLHPGRSAAVVIADAVAGWLGEIHPLVARGWELGPTLAGLEVDLIQVTAAAPPVSAYRDVTSYPAVRQDLAVVVGEETPAARVLEALAAGAGPLLARARVFDVYRGEQVGPGRVSLAVRCEFRAPDRTLSEAEVAELREQITATLAQRVGGTLRA